MRIRFYISSGIFIFVVLNIYVPSQSIQSVLAQSPELQPAQIMYIGEDQYVYIASTDGSQKQVVTPNNIRVTDAFWSPNGKEILFCSCSDTTYFSSTRFYVIDVDTKTLTKLDTTQTGTQPPAWSPNGQQIVFTTSTEERGNLLTIDKEGTNKKLLTTVDGSIHLFSWSPNAQFIAFVASRSGQYNLYIVNVSDLTTSGPFATGIWGISWSPDSRKIAWSPAFNDGDGRIRILNIENRGERVVSDGNVDGGAVWLSDGQKLVFGWQRNGISQLYSVNSDGTNLTNLTSNDKVWEAKFDISWDESKLAFLSYENGGSYVYTSNIDGTERQKLIEVDKFADWYPQWSTDGKYIAFITGDPTTHWYLNIIDPTGKHKTQIGTILRGDKFEWQP